MTAAWNHNIHHQPVLLDAVPRPCRRALDVGCGQGFLLEPLADLADEAVGVDLDEAALDGAARRLVGRDNVTLVQGDVLTDDLGGPFDAVLSVAVLHHVPLTDGLERMKALVAPGGVLGIIGLATTRGFVDLAYDGVGFVETRWRRRGRGYTDVGAPVKHPRQSYGQVRRAAQAVLPGVRYRRHTLFRYSLLWTKPA